MFIGRIYFPAKGFPRPRQRDFPAPSKGISRSQQKDFPLLAKGFPRPYQRDFPAPSKGISPLLAKDFPLLAKGFPRSQQRDFPDPSKGISPLPTRAAFLSCSTVCAGILNVTKGTCTDFCFLIYVPAVHTSVVCYFVLTGDTY